VPRGRSRHTPCTAWLLGRRGTVVSASIRGSSKSSSLRQWCLWVTVCPSGHVWPVGDFPSVTVWSSEQCRPGVSQGAFPLFRLRGSSNRSFTTAAVSSALLLRLCTVHHLDPQWLRQKSWTVTAPVLHSWPRYLCLWFASHFRAWLRHHSSCYPEGILTDEALGNYKSKRRVCAAIRRTHVSPPRRSPHRQAFPPCWVESQDKTL
jgi:hypothetical protein